MAKKVISVFRFDYVMGEGVNEKEWTAYIAGNNKDECVRYLGKFLGKSFKITTLGQECRLDAISDELRDEILKSVEPKIRPVGRPPGSKTKKDESDVEDEPIVNTEKPRPLKSK